jgi:hypothetical protein
MVGLWDWNSGMISEQVSRVQLRKEVLSKGERVKKEKPITKT